MVPGLTLVTEQTRELSSAGEFADAMSMFASGVVLVTCRVGDRPWGMTVSAFASVSADPPAVLVSLGSETTSARAIAETGRFGVGILAADQIAVARYGSAPGAAKFLELFAEAGDGSLSPVVVGALAHFDCELVEAVRVADHTVFFGHVRALRALQRRAPLLYHDHAYRRLDEPAGAHAPIERSVRCLSS